MSDAWDAEARNLVHEHCLPNASAAYTPEHVEFNGPALVTAITRALRAAEASGRKDAACLVQAMLEPPFDKSEIFGKPSSRVTLAIAVHAIERGRHLTESEQLANLKRAMDEQEAEEPALSEPSKEDGTDG